MGNSKCFFAVDLGATSGRTIVGTLSDGKIKLEEITRFPNNLIETGGHFYWDIYALYFEIIKGLKIVAKRNVEITSIGIDTWGVDFVCVGDTVRCCAIRSHIATLIRLVRWRSISKRKCQRRKCMAPQAYSL